MRRLLTVLALCLPVLGSAQSINYYPLTGTKRPLGTGTDAIRYFPFEVNPRWDNLIAGWALDEYSNGSAPVNRADVLGTVTLVDAGPTPTSSVSGVIGNGIRILATGGTLMRKVGDPPTWTGRGAVTIIGWARAHTLKSSFNGIFAGDTGALTLGFRDSDDAAYCYVTATVYGLTGANAIPAALNDWYHVACVFDGSGSTNADKLKIYVNGVESTPLTFPGGNVPTTLGSNTGARLEPPSGTNNLDLDEVYVFSDAKDATWVTAMYNAGAGRQYPN